MRTGEATPYSLNPEGIPVDLMAAEEMISKLNQVTDGEKTESSSAKSDLEEAQNLYAHLEKLQSAGPEVSVILKALEDAIVTLQEAIRRVD